eukprot:TRINITY_DN14492_c0_g1_i15.p1 TRINITY_DN14492_c0_g1~~TRINITY_DN14492_c0_g1_i15.p1  ORF type:complete len:112 (+),score=27.59 TRINITY_DN14492_c0_g1_i15:549-884(+)
MLDLLVHHTHQNWESVSLNYTKYLEISELKLELASTRKQWYQRRVLFFFFFFFFFFWEIYCLIHFLHNKTDGHHQRSKREVLHRTTNKQIDRSTSLEKSKIRGQSGRNEKK